MRAMAQVGVLQPAMTSAVGQMFTALKAISLPDVAPLDAATMLETVRDPAFVAAGDPVRRELVAASLAGGRFMMRQIAPTLTTPQLDVMDSTLMPMLRAVNRKIMVSVQESMFTQWADPVTDVTPLQRTVSQRATIARTAALDAFKIGQQVAIGQLLQRGYFPFGGGVMWKTWVNMGDNKVRLEHQYKTGLAGQTVPWDQPYSNGDMYPGASTWNCRCINHYTWEM